MYFLSVINDLDILWLKNLDKFLQKLVFQLYKNCSECLPPGKGFREEQTDILYHLCLILQNPPPSNLHYSQVQLLISYVTYSSVHQCPWHKNILSTCQERKNLVTLLIIDKGWFW